MESAGTGGSASDRAPAVEREVLARITPDPEMLRRVRGATERLVGRAMAAASERKSPMVRCLVAGSAARGTFLSDRLDIDLFLLFPTDLSRQDLEKEGLALGDAVLTDPTTKYAEHPYRCGTFEGFRVDAVPGYAVEDPSKPLSAVDRTPFHQEYLTAHQTPPMVDQVRLTKQFLRSLGVYGSEARTGGFSGYLVELLVLRFGSLRGLLRNARAWRIPVRMLSSPSAAPRVPDDVALLLDDPVDPHRNVASALSRRNMGLFILSAGEYLDRPTASAFALRDPPSLQVEAARRRVSVRRTHVTALGLPRPTVVEDILYPQLHKAERAMAEEAGRLGFRVVGTASAAGRTHVVLLIEVEHGELPSARFQDGPPAGIDRAGEFLDKWSDPKAPVLQGPYVTSDGRLAVETRRPERQIEDLLGGALAHLSLGKDLRAGIGPETRLISLDAAASSPELARALGDLLEKRLPWLPPRSGGEGEDIEQ